jgi:AcrR family transcriptional regulator
MTAKREKAASTKATIVAVARRLFATNGYAGTSVEAVLEESQVSRGALYYHFETKEALFAAVLEAVEIDVTETTGRAAANLTNPVEALAAACGRFLDMACEPEVRQIVLTDAHAVVGWEKWREIEQRHGFGRVKQALKFIAAGSMEDEMVDAFAHILLASLLELAFLVARATDPEAAAKTGRAAMKQLLEHLLGPSSAAQRRSSADG